MLNQGETTVAQGENIFTGNSTTAVANEMLDEVVATGTDMISSLATKAVTSTIKSDDIAATVFVGDGNTLVISTVESLRDAKNLANDGECDISLKILLHKVKVI